jgi:hypothetical protein
MWQADPYARLRAAVALVALIAAGGGSALAATEPPELTASLSTEELTLGGALSITGRLTSAGDGLARTPLTLQGSLYPFRNFTPIAHAVAAADGSFSFTGIRPDRNIRLRVLSEGSTAVTGRALVATVDPKVSSSARSLGPGRVRLSLRVRHAITGNARSVSAWWFLAGRRSRVFRLAAVTATRELSPGVTYASVIVDPPVRRFVYRICMNPPWEKAMGPAATHRRCPEATFVVGGHGS